MPRVIHTMAEPADHTEEASPAEAGQSHPTDANDLLLAFLRDHEAPCPVCEYELRGLTRPMCPECGHELALTVGVLRPHIGWLLVALAPGFFSGIAAFFVLVPIVMRLWFGDGQMSPGLTALDLFGWCSGLFTLILIMNRHRFLAQPRVRQRWWAIGIWSVHIAAFLLFVLIVLVYL